MKQQRIWHVICQKIKEKNVEEEWQKWNEEIAETKAKRERGPGFSRIRLKSKSSKSKSKGTRTKFRSRARLEH